MRTGSPDPQQPPTAHQLRLRSPSPADGAAMWRLAAEVGLDVNSPYAYVMWGRSFSATSVIAVEESGDGAAAGFVTGFRSPDGPDTVFVWQIGVRGRARGLGLGSRMLDHLASSSGARFVEATVTPDNTASAALFRSFAGRHGAALTERPAFGRDLFPDGHEPEVLFRIGPLADLDRRHHQRSDDE